MLKICAIFFGIAALIVGTLGFFPQANPNGLFLGLFHVDDEHNLIYLATGVASILCGAASGSASHLFFRIIGALYALFAVVGLCHGDRAVFGLFVNNRADVILYMGIAAFALFLGFVYRHHPHHDTR